MSRTTPRRRRPWTSAGLASASLHLLAVLALGTIAGRQVRGPAGGADLFGPVVALALVRLPDAPDRPASASPAAASPLPAMAPARRDPEPISEERPSNSDAAAGVVDVDPLFRAPFRDAVRQAYASMRGGLGCAHVELAALPEAVRALCDTASGLNTTQQDPTLDGGPSRAGRVDSRWRFQALASVGPD